MKNVSNVSEGIIENIKRTKNVSVKNLTVDVIHENGSVDKINEPNMHQVWNFIHAHYTDKKNLKNTIKVYQGEKLLKDIHAEEKASGKIWKVDKMQIGKHVKAKPEKAVVK